MIETSRGKADSIEMALLLGGIAAVLLAYFLPAVTFAGQRGAAVYGLSIFSKLPIMSALAFAAMAAALATRVIPSLEKYAEQAAVIAILMALAPALLGTNRFSSTTRGQGDCSEVWFGLSSTAEGVVGGGGSRAVVRPRILRLEAVRRISASW